MNKKMVIVVLLAGIGLLGSLLRSSSSVKTSSFALRATADVTADRSSSEGQALLRSASFEGQAGEFTKKTTRKEKAQAETAYNDCVQLIDMLIEESCKIQQKLADLTARLYKKLRSCAMDEKPDLVQKETRELRAVEQALKVLKNQLQELEKAIAATEKAL